MNTHELKNLALKSIPTNESLIHIRNVAWLYMEHLVRIVLGLLVGAWVARYLGPEQFGVFSYALAFVGIFGVLARAGLDTIVVRDLVIRPGEVAKYLGTAFWLKMLGAICSLVLIFLTTKIFSYEPVEVFYILLISTHLLIQPLDVVDFLFQSEVRNRDGALCRISQLMISAFVKIYLILVGASLGWFCFVVVLEQGFLGLAYYLVYRTKRSPRFLLSFDRRLAASLIRESWPIILSGLAIMLYIRLDRIVVGKLLGEYDLGIYSASSSLVEALFAIPYFAMNSLFPLLIKSNAISENEYHKSIRRISSILFGVSFLIVVIFYFSSELIVDTLYGEKFYIVADLLKIQVFSLIFVSFGVITAKCIIIDKVQILALWKTAGGVIVNLTLNFLLIPILGLYGAALSATLSHCMVGLVFDLFSKNLRLYFILKLRSITLKW